MNAEQRAELQALGYDVEEAAGIVSVRGFGIATVYASDDRAGVASVLDPKSHAVRKAQVHRHDSPRKDALDNG